MAMSLDALLCCMSCDHAYYINNITVLMIILQKYTRVVHVIRCDATFVPVRRLATVSIILSIDHRYSHSVSSLLVAFLHQDKGDARILGVVTRTHLKTNVT